MTANFWTAWIVFMACMAIACALGFGAGFARGYKKRDGEHRGTQ